MIQAHFTNTILLIEDDPKTTQFLKQGFEENGIAVTVCADGRSGLDLALQKSFSVIVIDGMLPELDGVDVVKQLRQAGSPSAIIFLTARDTVPDRVAGIEAGADVYLVKPFSFSELLAYTRALAQRRSDPKSTSDASCLRLGDLEIDLARQRARRSGNELSLTAKEFSLLAFLARRKEEVLTRNAIAEEVWGLNYDPGTNFVDVHIRRLRSKVDEPFALPLIQTVRGIGYKLSSEP